MLPAIVHEICSTVYHIAIWCVATQIVTTLYIGSKVKGR